MSLNILILHCVRSVSRTSSLASQSLRQKRADPFSFYLDECPQVVIVVRFHILLAAPVCLKKESDSFSHPHWCIRYITRGRWSPNAKEIQWNSLSSFPMQSDDWNQWKINCRWLKITDTLLPADFSLEHLSLLSFTHISSFPMEGALRSK